MRSSWRWIRAAAASVGMSSTIVRSGISPPVATRPTLPERRHVQAAGVALVDDIGQQVAVADDGLARGQRGPDQLLDQLGPGGHVEEHFAAAIDVQVVALEEHLADGLAQGGAARVAAGDHLVALLSEPLAKQCDLGRFSGAVAAVDGEKH